MEGRPRTHSGRRQRFRNRLDPLIAHSDEHARREAGQICILDDSNGRDGNADEACGVLGA
jgi:hypothetical protein